MAPLVMRQPMALLAMALVLAADPALAAARALPPGPMERGAAGTPGSATDVYAPGVWYPLRLRVGTATTVLLPAIEDVSPSSIVVGDRSVRTRVIGTHTVEILPTRRVAGVALTIYGRSGNTYPFWLVDAGKEMPDLIVTMRDGAGRGSPSSVGGAVETVAEVGIYQPSAPGDPGYDDPMVARVLGALPAPFRREIFDPASIAVPHQIYEHAAGDAAAIGPVRVVEDRGHTYFDFGPNFARRPHPTITFNPGGLRSTAHFTVNRDFPEVVIADQVGNFTMRYGGHVVCIVRKVDRWAGLATR